MGSKLGIFKSKRFAGPVEPLQCNDPVNHRIKEVYQSNDRYLFFNKKILLSFFCFISINRLLEMGLECQGCTYTSMQTVVEFHSVAGEIQEMFLVYT